MPPQAAYHNFSLLSFHLPSAMRSKAKLSAMA